MNIKLVKEYLNKLGIEAKKSFGQNFLINEDILKHIVDIPKFNENDLIIEVGPGMGSLTEYLLKTNLNVFSYEIDKDMVNILNDRFKDISNFHLYLKDYMESDVLNDIKDYIKTDTNIYFISNLPYYITTPILLKTLEILPKATIIIMVQKEVGDRLCGKVKTKEYNSLSVLVQYNHIAKTMFEVSKNSFYPEPDVTSSVVKIEYKKNDLEPININFFYSFNRNIFKLRRKTLLNNLKNSYNYKKEDILDILNKHNLKETVRSEELSVNEIIKLSDSFYMLGK